MRLILTVDLGLEFTFVVLGFGYDGCFVSLFVLLVWCFAANDFDVGCWDLGVFILC